VHKGGIKILIKFKRGDGELKKEKKNSLKRVKKINFERRVHS
jgi:hypothetical protein